jgi:ABC-type multidrug transport system fused ATPase/permease subunit
MDQGKSLEEGDLNALLAQKGKFYQYWETQTFF